MDADFETLLEYLERKIQPVQVSSAPEKKCAWRHWDWGRVCLFRVWFSPWSSLLPRCTLAGTRSESKRTHGHEPLECRGQDLSWFHRQSRLVQFAPAPPCTRTAKGDEISKSLQKSQICHCPDMHTAGTWAASRENSPFLPRSNAAWAGNLIVLDPVQPAFVISWLKKLLNPPPLEISLKRRKDESSMHFNILMRPNFKSCMIWSNVMAWTLTRADM